MHYASQGWENIHYFDWDLTRDLKTGNLDGGLWRGLSRQQNSCCPWGHTPEIQAVERQRKDKPRIHSKFGAHLSLFERARKRWGWGGVIKKRTEKTKSWTWFWTLWSLLRGTERPQNLRHRSLVCIATASPQACILSCWLRLSNEIDQLQKWLLHWMFNCSVVILYCVFVCQRKPVEVSV